MVDLCRQFSPIVAIDPSGDSLLLDITGLEHLFSSEAELAETVVKSLTQRGHRVRAVVADTPGAAWALTRNFGQRGAGLVFVPSGLTINALRPLPLAAIRLPDDIVNLLHQLGIDRIGQLERLPRSELTSRFGPVLLERWDQVMGLRPDPVIDHPSPPELEAECVLEYATAARETLGAAIERLVGQLAPQLREHGLGALRLRCRLDVGLEKPVEFLVGLFQPTASASHLASLVKMQLERLSLAGPVSRLCIETLQTAPLERRQQELFTDDFPRRHPRHLAGLIDRLSSRIGSRAVLRARLVADAQPELAYAYLPLVEVRRRGGVNKPAGLPPRPLRLLVRPVPLAVVSVVPEGPPVKFHLYDRTYQVAWSWGPERIETGWWRHRRIGRDYYRIETTTGQRYWLFRRLGDERWFMHGMFE